ncbi:MAG: relaxase/mobilization nuclease domain-containing protein, partial [Oscillospiraceae bacterium]
MAVTSLWAVKNSLADVVNYAKNPEKTECPDLAQVLRYAGNDGKTEHRYFVTGVGCLAETAGEQMLNTKRRFGKSGGYVAYHGYQSFKPGELTPAQAHEIGIEFAKRLWGERYEVLVATHLNTDCCHNHFVVNSVSFVDGKKLVVKKGTHLELRRVSDALCRERGLSVIEHPQGKTPRSLYQAEKRGEPTKYTLMRDALDRAMAVSHAPGDLSRMLKLYGYQLSPPENRKYVTICAINGGKPTRLYQLGEDYSLERMQVRIRQNSYTVQIEQPRYQKITTPPQKMRCRGSLLRCRKITGFQALYVHYLFFLGIVPKGRHKPLSPALREDLRRLDRYVAQHRFLCREGLNTVDEVTEFAQNKRVTLADKCGQREHCCNRL